MPLMHLSTNIWKTSVKWVQGPPPPGAGRADVSVKEQLLQEKHRNSINRTRPSPTHSPMSRPNCEFSGGEANPCQRRAKVFGTWNQEVIRTLTIMPSASQGVRPCQPGPAPAACSPHILGRCPRAAKATPRLAPHCWLSLAMEGGVRFQMSSHHMYVPRGRL